MNILFCSVSHNPWGDPHVLLHVILLHMTLYGKHRVSLCTESLFINPGILIGVSSLSEKTVLKI